MGRQKVEKGGYCEECDDGPLVNIAISGLYEVASPRVVEVEAKRRKKLRRGGERGEGERA